MEADISENSFLRVVEGATNHDRHTPEHEKYQIYGTEGNREKDEEAGHTTSDDNTLRRRRCPPWLFWLLSITTLLIVGFSSPVSIRCHLHGGAAIDTSSKSLPKRDVTDQKVLQVFQVAAPVLAPKQQASSPLQIPIPFSRNLADGGSSDKQTGDGQSAFRSSCVVTQQLMQHTFAFSYDKPFVGEYHPPSCRFNRVIMNMTVTSRGRQFDRLAIMYLGDTEVYRTSTAEPTSDGIYWTYTKDMTPYLTLFKEPQKIIFDLGNLVNEIYNGSFNITLTATFFTSAESVSPADVIIPISARRSGQNQPSAWLVPEQTANNSVKFPRNVARAMFTISTSGNGDEEFWYSNVLNSDRTAFGGQPLLGYSPFREVQLKIDGKLAGVAWPFPVVFTGGVVPGLWRPIVGIDAFDLKEYEIDITPWLSILCDGNPNGHEFSLNVVGLDDDGKENGKLSDKVGNNWITTGKIFLWTDKPGTITKGNPPQIYDPAIDIRLKSVRIGKLTEKTGTLGFEVKVSRRFSVTTMIRTAMGVQKVRWLQSLVFTNTGVLTDGSNRQITLQQTTGLDLSTNGYSRQYNYPFSANTTYYTEPDSGNFSISANISRSIYLNQLGDGVFPSALQAFGAIPGLPKIPGIESLSPLPSNMNPNDQPSGSIFKPLPKVAGVPIIPIAALLGDMAKSAKAGFKSANPPGYNGNPLKDIFKALGPVLKVDPGLVQDILKPFAPFLGQQSFSRGKEPTHNITRLTNPLNPLMGPIIKPFKPLTETLGQLIIRPYKGFNLATTQNGTAMFFSAPSKKWSSGFGTTEQTFAFRGVRTLGLQSTWPPSGGGRISGDIDPGGYETYERHVKAINSTIVIDSEKFAGKTIGDYNNTNFTSYVSPEDVSQVDFVASSVNALLGRGPGKKKPTLVFRGTVQLPQM